MKMPENSYKSPEDEKKHRRKIVREERSNWLVIYAGICTLIALGGMFWFFFIRRD